MAQKTGSTDQEIENKVKEDLRLIARSSPESADLAQLQRDYRSLNGTDIPFKTLGYDSLEQFVHSIPEISQDLTDSSVQLLQTMQQKSDINLPERAVILNRTPNYAYLYCKDLLHVFLPRSEWRCAEYDDFVLPGVWVEFWAEKQSEKQGCSWIARRARNSTFSQKFEFAARTLVLKDVPGIITHISTGGIILWTDLLGRVMAEKKIFENCGQLKLLDKIVAQVQPIQEKQLGDISWKARQIQPGILQSFTIVKAKLNTIPCDGCAMLSAEGYPKIFMSYMDYHKDFKNHRDFHAEIEKVEHFEAFIVPNLKQHDCKWRVIFARPWAPIVTDKSKESKLRKGFDKTDHFIEFEEASIQTDKFLEATVLRTIADDSRAFGIIKSNHRDLMRPIMALTTGRLRSLDRSNWQPDIAQAVCETSEEGKASNAEIQTADFLEMEIIRRLIHDEEIDNFMLENHEQLWNELCFSTMNY